MRIGMLLDSSFPPDSRVENEAVSLIKAGHEVHLFSLCYKRKQPLNEVINGIHVHRYPAGKLIYKFSALAYTVPVYHFFVGSRIKHFINQYQIEVLHVHDMLLAQAAFDINIKSKLPLVLDLHENRPEIMRHYHWVNKWSGRLFVRRANWEKKQKEFIKQADRVIVVTEQAVAQAIKETGINPAKIIAVPNTTTPEIFNAYPIVNSIIDRFKNKFTLVYVGDTGLRRGTDLAIKAVAKLKPQIPEIQLVLVGRSKEDPVLFALAKQLKVFENVSFEGWQDVSLFPSYITTAQVCISPLVRNLHHDTTFANKIFQYMAMGKPLIVSDCPPQAEVVETEHCGLVHKADDADDLAQKILELYNQPALRLQMGANGKRAVNERYNWHITSQQLTSMYKNLEKE